MISIQDPSKASYTNKYNQEVYFLKNQILLSNRKRNRKQKESKENPMVCSNEGNSKGRRPYGFALLNVTLISSIFLNKKIKIMPFFESIEGKLTRNISSA